MFNMYAGAVVIVLYIAKWWRENLRRKECLQMPIGDRYRSGEGECLLHWLWGWTLLVSAHLSLSDCLCPFACLSLRWSL